MAAKERRSAWVALAASLACLAAFFLAAGPARAAESLDPSFGEEGISFPGLGGGDIRGLAQDQDGRLVSGGGAGIGIIRIARYLRNGALDLSFGDGDGRTINEFGSRANAVAIQRDGKILAAGSTEAGNFVLVRYEKNGNRLDPSFGGKLRGTSRQPGRTVTIAGFYGGGAQDLDIEPNGRILAAGYGIDFHHNWKAMLTAYRPNGAPDTGFGRDGILTLKPKAKGEVPIELVGVKALPSGKILAAGDVAGRVMLLRLWPNGKPDRSFGGGDGLVFTDPSSKRCACSYATDMEFDRRGRILVSANLTAPRNRQAAALIRYRPNGKLDRSFARKGIARTVVGSRLGGKDIAIQRNAKILLAGTYNVPKTGEARVAALRYLPDGRLDRGFARRGVFTRDFGVEGVAYAALTQRDGRVVIGGRANPKPSPFHEDPSVYDTARVFLIRFLP
jgi:uncharacterized delta-60 repeat protein